VDSIDPDVARLADDIERFVYGGDSEERAASRLEAYGVPRERISQALRVYGERVGRIREVRDPRTLLANELRTGGWYGGPQPGDIYWPAFRFRLGFDEVALASVDNRSNRIVSLLTRPGAEEIRTRGLVLGHVQSGKTTSFMSVIAKAADAGYRMFIVLSGITDNLRSQTQARLDQALVGAESDERTRWRWLTEPDQDFAYSAFYAPNMLRDDGSRIVAVVKKNPYRLRRLATFLEGAGEPILRSCPILLIDDEADQATINVAQRARVSRINALIRRILSQPKAGYVAYTATPFANLLINPSDYENLYPRHFIVDLNPPDDYFGTEKIFGRAPLDATDDSADDGLDLVRPVSDADVAAVRPASRNAVATWSPSVPDSLAEALRWFVLATAARRARDGRASHSTMLIHTSMLTAAHSALQQCIRPYFDSLARAVAAGDNTVLEQQWTDETGRMPAAVFQLSDVPWNEVHPRLGGVLSDLRVLVDNYQSADRLSYPPDDPQTIVAIGGNTLSRGLTLEGLVCSYFVRSATAYDTLLQMGRWFGYRPGYGDLVRIWMTADLEGWFFDLATVEAEIRQQIARYEAEDLTPEQLPVKIRTHPAMVVTATAKMRDHVVADISYGGQREQTILFNHTDADWLQNNIYATAQLFHAAEAAGALAQRGPLGGIVFRDVPVDVITAFLRAYRFHERAERLKPDLLTGYIGLQNQHFSLLTWNIAVITDRRAGSGIRPIGGHELNLITRTRLAMPGITHANIKALVSRIDRAADVDLPRDEIIRQAGADTDEAYATLRHDYFDRVGLLCIYPIARDSVPRGSRAGRSPGYKPRLPLDAADDVIGVGLFFPEDKSNTPYRYVSADLSGLAIDTDEPDVDQLDREDEEVGRAQEAAADQRGGGGAR
jgi:Z1 domain